MRRWLNQQTVDEFRYRKVELRDATYFGPTNTKHRYGLSIKINYPLQH